MRKQVLRLASAFAKPLTEPKQKSTFFWAYTCGLHALRVMKERDPGLLWECTALQTSFGTLLVFEDLPEVWKQFPSGEAAT